VVLLTPRGIAIMSRSGIDLHFEVHHFGLKDRAQLKLAGDLEPSGLEENLEDPDEVALGDSVDIGFMGHGVTSMDVNADGIEPGHLEQIEYRPTTSGLIDYQGGTAGQSRRSHYRSDLLSDVRVGLAPYTFQTTQMIKRPVFARYGFQNA